MFLVWRNRDFCTLVNVRLEIVAANRQCCSASYFKLVFGFQIGPCLWKAPVGGAFEKEKALCSVKRNTFLFGDAFPWYSVGVPRSCTC